MSRRMVPSWLNREKAIFGLASIWLLTMGLNYVHAPRVLSWGPARTGSVDSATCFVCLNDLVPLDLSGRNDVFLGAPPEKTPTSNGGTPVVGGESVDEEQNIDGNSNRGEGAVVDAKDEDERVATQAFRESEVAFVGSVQVERRRRWFVFEDRLMHRCHAARDGETLPGLGLRVVEVKGRTPVTASTSPPED